MMLKAVIFDVDGTLVDSVDLHAEAWQEALRKFGHEVELSQVRQQIGKGGDQLMPVFLSRQEIEERGEELQAYRSRIFSERYLPRVKAFPGASDLLRKINLAGIRVALASSASQTELAELKRIAGVEHSIDAETSADDAERSKPHPDIFEAALARMPGVSPDDAVVVGDTPYDAEAAGKIGLRTIGLLCGGFPEEDLRTAGCIAIFRDPAHLLEDYEVSILGAGGMPD